MLLCFFQRHLSQLPVSSVYLNDLLLLHSNKHRRISWLTSSHVFQQQRNSLIKSTSKRVKRKPQFWFTFRPMKNLAYIWAEWKIYHHPTAKEKGSTELFAKEANSCSPRLLAAASLSINFPLNLAGVKRAGASTFQTGPNLHIRVQGKTGLRYLTVFSTHKMSRQEPRPYGPWCQPIPLFRVNQLRYHAPNGNEMASKVTCPKLRVGRKQFSSYVPPGGHGLAHIKDAQWQVTVKQ